MFSEREILEQVGAGEAKDWELKSAKGGVPAALWETYSAMANTDGGSIVLGVAEKDGSFTVHGLDNPARARKTFWDTINDRGKISANLLTNENVAVREVEGTSVL